MSFFYFVFIVLILNINIISAPKVKSVFPASNSLTSEKNTQIIIEFENGIDPSSINDSSFMVWGKWSGVHKGNIVLLENNKKIIFRSNKNFSVGEIITVSLSKKIKDVQSEQMQNGYAWNFWIKPSSTSINLSLKGKINVRKNGESSLQTYGAYAGDLNEDGCGDFFVPNEKSNDARVFINDCSGNYGDFQIFPIPFGDEPSTNEASDFNMDGHIDIAVGNSESRTVSLFFGNGSGGFSSIKNFQADTEVRGLSIIDLDADGLMDIVTANRVGNNISLIKNLGKENFADPVNIEAQGIGETACVSADANNDGIMDLFVGAITSREIILLLGDGNGNLFFSDKVKINGSPWMITAGDVDLDGNLDVVSANSSGNNFSLIKGDGLGKLLTPVNYNAGQFPIAVDLGDIDGDGDLDIAVSNFDSADFTI
ncbi:MAG: FG-GAP-like repeat-containing protein, partial [Ignavibacteriaceae bacterium]